MRKLWGSASSQPPPPPPASEKPSPPISIISTPIPSYSPQESISHFPEVSSIASTPGLFIKKNRKQGSVVSVSENAANLNMNASFQSAPSGSDTSPSISPTRTSFTSSSRKPVPNIPVTSPIAGPSSPKIPPPTPLRPRKPLSSQWKRTSGLLNIRDDLLMSLLTSDAVVDSRECEILSGEEVEELKKEHQILKIRLAAAQKKLKLETKIRDAALSLSKLNAAHKKLSKATDDQLEAAERRVNNAQTELWRVSERASEVQRKLLEHRAGVLGYCVTKLERKTIPSGDVPGSITSNRSSTFSSVTTTSTSSKPRFDGAHLFAGHADALIPKAPPSIADLITLEEKLRIATEALSAANQKQAEMARELSHLRLEKDQIETTMGMELQAADETVAALENELPRLEELKAEWQQAREEWNSEKAMLQSIWNILPAPELRAARLNSKPHLGISSTPSSPGGSSPTKSAVPSLSDMDVRALKSLYDVRSQPATPPAEQGKCAFSIEAFAGRVEALIADDRALIERLIRFAQAHDLLKKNAGRAQKLAQDSNAALETYQRQVTTLEGHNMTLVSKQGALMNEIHDLQNAIERAVGEKREVEIHAADQGETCLQLTEANNALSAKMLTLAEEAAAAPGTVRKQLDSQLIECSEALRKAQEEIEEMRKSEQTQRIALLDELNLMQTENGNLRAQLRAVKK